MTAKTLIATIGIGLLAAMPLAGCGGDDDGEGGGGGTGGYGGSAPAGQAGGAGKGGAVTISETEYALDPARPSIAPGKVTFKVVNDGQVDHALEVHAPSGEEETDTIAPGESATLAVDLSKPGSYKMYCPIANHEQLGMVGRVVVK